MTGGKGELGTEVVRRLEARGATVTSASRRTGVDLATGAGLEAALDGAECVVHAASHRLRYRRVDLDGTRRMIKILADRPAPPHIIYISIVGCDRIPLRYLPREVCLRAGARAQQAAGHGGAGDAVPHLGSGHCAHRDASVRWRSCPGACHSNRATIVGSPLSLLTSHLGRRRRALQRAADRAGPEHRQPRRGGSADPRQGRQAGPAADHASGLRWHPPRLPGRRQPPRTRTRRSAAHPSAISSPRSAISLSEPHVNVVSDVGSDLLAGQTVRALSSASSLPMVSLASPKSRVVVGSYSSSFSMPAKPGRMERFMKTTWRAWLACRIGMP